MFLSSVQKADHLLTELAGQSGKTLLNLIDQRSNTFVKLFYKEKQDIGEGWTPETHLDAKRIKSLHLDCSKLDKIVKKLDEAIQIEDEEIQVKEEGLPPNEEQSDSLTKVKKVRDALKKLKEISNPEAELKKEEEIKEVGAMEASRSRAFEELRKSAQKELKETISYDSDVLVGLERRLKRKLGKKMSRDDLVKASIEYAEKKLKPGQFMVIDSILSHPVLGNHENPPYIYFDLYSNKGQGLEIKSIRYRQQNHWSIKLGKDYKHNHDNQSLKQLLKDKKLIA